VQDLRDCPCAHRQPAARLMCPRCAPVECGRRAQRHRLHHGRER
jgi:hypothetical protein